MMIRQMLKNQKSFGETYELSWDPKWLKDLQSEVNVTKQEKADKTNESFKKILGRMPN